MRSIPVLQPFQNDRGQQEQDPRFVTVGLYNLNQEPFGQCELLSLFYFSHEIFSSTMLPTSAVQKRDSDILFHYGLSQAIEYSSLCYTVGPCRLSILYITVSI